MRPLHISTVAAVLFVVGSAGSAWPTPLYCRSAADTSVSASVRNVPFVPVTIFAEDVDAVSASAASFTHLATAHMLVNDPDASATALQGSFVRGTLLSGILGACTLRPTENVSQLIAR